MRALIFGSLVFLIWGSIARYYYVCEIKGLCSTETVAFEAPTQSLMLKSGEEVIMENFDQFKFIKGNTLPSLNDNNNLFLDSLSKLLIMQPEKNLTITSHFLESEKDTPLKYTLQENIGLARAEAIKNLLVARDADEANISLDFKIIGGKKILAPISFELFPIAVYEENL